MSSKHLAWFVGLFAVGLYLQTLSYPFLHYDDWWLVHNPILAKNLTLSGIGSVLFDFSKQARMDHGAEYLPVRDLYASLQYVLFGEHAILYRMTHLVLYGFVTFLVVLFVQALGMSVAASIFMALLFAAHPIHVETVSWLSCQKDLLSLLFLFLASLFYAKGKLHWSMLFFLLGLGSKYQTIVFPILLPFIDLCMDGKFDRKKWTPYAILGLFSFLVFVSVGETVRYGSIQLGNRWFEILYQSFLMVTESVEHLLIPIKLQILYPFTPVRSILEGRGLFGVICMLLTVWALFRFKKVRPRILLGLCFFWVGLIPMLRAPEMHWVADRYLMLSSFGFILIIVELLGSLPKTLLIPSFILVLLLFSILSFRQTKIWRSDENLWAHTVYGEKPVQRKAFESYGMALLENKKWDEAGLIFQRLVDWPIENRANYSNEFLNLGFIKLEQGHLAEAEKNFKLSIKLHPSVQGYMNLGTVLAIQKKYADAEKNFKMASQLDPENQEARKNIQMLRLEQKNRQIIK